MKIEYPGFWKTATPRQKRFYSILFILILAVVVTVITSLIPISQSNAQTISGSLNSTLNVHKANGTLTEYIFLNNFGICLLMFVPIIGPILGFFILGNTGYALGAISQVQGYPAYIGLLSEFLTPVFWLEFISYSTAMASSIWLTRRLIQGRWGELKYTAIMIAICAAILAVSAVIEVYLISIGV